MQNFKLFNGLHCKKKKKKSKIEKRKPEKTNNQIDL